MDTDALMVPWKTESIAWAYHVLFQAIFREVRRNSILALLLLGHVPNTCITIIRDLEICKRCWYIAFMVSKNKIEHWIFYIKMELEVFMQAFIRRFDLTHCMFSVALQDLVHERCFLCYYSEDLLLHNVQIKHQAPSSPQQWVSQQGAQKGWCWEQGLISGHVGKAHFVSQKRLG